MNGVTMLAFGSIHSYAPVTRSVPSGGAMSHGTFGNSNFFETQRSVGVVRGPCGASSRLQQRTAQTTPTSTSLGAVSELVGSSEELGGVFDPLGLATDETSLYRRRVAELKHGRVCMLATVGVLVQSFVHLPDPEKAAFSNPRPLGALLQVWNERPAVLVLIVVIMGVIELTVGREDYSRDDPEPGRLGEIWQMARPEDPQLWRRRQLQELKHGRLASLGITGMLAQELVTHEGPIEQLIKGDINPFGTY